MWLSKPYATLITWGVRVPLHSAVDGVVLEHEGVVQVRAAMVDVVDQHVRKHTNGHTLFVELNDLKLTPVVHLYVVCAVPSTRTGYAR